jgi:hypothetical protein
VAEPKMKTENEEGFLVQGKTQEEKDQQTRFRIYKIVLDSGERMKADIGEHPCILSPGAFTNMDGVNVATVPILAVSQICAISTPNRKAAKNDIEDLYNCLLYLVMHEEIVSMELQNIFLRVTTPDFTWTVFWNNINKAILEKAKGDSQIQVNEADLEGLLHETGFEKVQIFSARLRNNHKTLTILSFADKGLTTAVSPRCS